MLAGIVAVAACGGGGDGGSGDTPSPRAELRFVLASNSDPAQGSVSIFTLDAESGALGRHPQSPYSEGVGPDAKSIAVTPSGRFAYVASSTGNDVCALAINPLSGQITFVASYQFASPPQFVAVEPLGRFAYIAFASGTVDAFAINTSTGALAPIAGGSGAAANPKHVSFGRSGQFAHVADGFETITTFTVDQNSGALTLPQTHVYMWTPPFAPLPVASAVDVLGKFVYSVNSGQNSVSLFSVDQTTGALAEVGSPVTVGFGPNAVAVEPSGRFAYVTNSVGSISILVIDAVSGNLSVSDTQPLPSNPQWLAVDHSGRFLYVTLSAINRVAAFRIDPLTGALTAVNGSPFETGLNPHSVVETGPVQ